MQSSDLEIYNLTNQFERLGTCKPSGPQKSLETRIYEVSVLGNPPSKHDVNCNTGAA